MFDKHRRAHRLRTSGQNAVLILAAAPLQVCVQLIEVTSFGKRHPVVAAEVASFPFHAALLVATGRVAKLALKAPVRAKRNETAGLLAAISAQHLLHRTLQVVVTQRAEHAAEVGKRKLMRFEKR